MAIIRQVERHNAVHVQQHAKVIVSKRQGSVLRVNRAIRTRMVSVHNVRQEHIQRVELKDARHALQDVQQRVTGSLELARIVMLAMGTRVGRV